MLMRAAVVDGDSVAYQRLLASLTPALRALARRNCARVGLDGGDAEDVVQEVLLAVHLKRSTWDRERPIVPWIMAIARNKLIDARRRRGNRQSLPIDDLMDVLPAEPGDDPTDRHDLDRLLAKLGERQRDLVRSLSVEGRSVQETAAPYERRGCARGASPRHQGARRIVSAGREMKTEDLVGALVADLGVTRPFRRIFAGAMALGALAALGVFLAFIGVRPDIAHAVQSPRFLTKLVVTLLLAAATTGLLLRLSVPDASPGRWSFAWLAAPILLALAVAAELIALPGADWGRRLVGVNARMCLLIIPMLAIGPLACLLMALRQAAPSRPGLAGAVAGLVAGGVAATLYASHCVDDSPLFVATWYTLAIGFVALAGYVAGSRLLRW